MQERYCLQMVACNGGCEDANTEDTGWLDILGTELATENFIETPNNGPITYRRIGKVVYLQGSFNFLIGNDGGTQVVFQLPEGFRPHQHISSVISGKQGESLQKGLINFAENGNVVAHSMVNWTNHSITTGEVTAFHINVSFPVD